MYVALGNMVVHGDNSPALGIALAGIGAVAAWVGWRTRARYQRLAEAGVRVQAQVIRMQRSWSSGADGTGGSYTYTPVVYFRTKEGQGVTVKSNLSTGGMPFQVGEMVSMLYDPADPQSIMLDGYDKGWMPIFMLGLGALFAIGGVAALISAVIT